MLFSPMKVGGADIDRRMLVGWLRPQSSPPLTVLTMNDDKDVTTLHSAFQRARRNSFQQIYRQHSANQTVYGAKTCVMPRLHVKYNYFKPISAFGLTSWLMGPFPVLTVFVGVSSCFWCDRLHCLSYCLCYN